MSNAIYRPLRTPHNDVRSLLLLILNDNNALIHCNDILDKVHRDTQDFEVKDRFRTKQKQKAERTRNVVTLCILYTIFSSSVPYVASFSVRSIFDCPFGIL